MAVKPNTNGADELDALYPLVLGQGKSGCFRRDAGSDFIATALQDWLRKVWIAPIQICPGHSWENGYTARSNGKKHRDVLNAQWLRAANQARVAIRI